MDRKSIYNKGRAGHARVVNSYRVWREKAKRWKFPIGGLVVVLALMVSVDLAGDSLHTNVLESFDASKAGDSGISLTEENLDVAKKGFLMLIGSELEGCREFQISQCISEGEALVNKVSSIDTVESANAFMKEVEDFSIRWSISKDALACHARFEDALLAVGSAIALFDGQQGVSGEAGALLGQTQENLLVLAKKCDF